MKMHDGKKRFALEIDRVYYSYETLANDLTPLSLSLSMYETGIVCSISYGSFVVHSFI